MNTITSIDNPLIKHFAKLLTNKRYREDNQSAVISGKTLVEEISRHQYIKTLLLSEDIRQTTIPADKTIRATIPALRRASGVEAPDGYVAEVWLPKHPKFPKCNSLIVCDAVSDPGNLGTIFRTALAFGWDNLFLLPDCCDPFNDKVLRAARGAPFILPYQYGTWDELKQYATDNQLTPYVADMNGQDAGKLQPVDKPLLILSNEARGVDAKATDWCRQLTIPIQSDMESLNVSVAGAILMYLLRPKN